MEHSAAILLRKIPWSETSFIITWLTREQGKIRTVVRGARRPGSPYQGMLDLFYEAEISFAPQARGDLCRLGDVSLVAPFDAARVGHANYCLCAYFAELADHAAPASQAAFELYDLMRRAVSHLREAPASLRALAHFERELCRVLGVHDSAGAVSALEALESLLGRIPRSRRVALVMMEGASRPREAVLAGGISA